MLCAPWCASAQADRGEIRLQVFDPRHAPLAARGEISSGAAHLNRAFVTDAAGEAVLRDLPFSSYQLRVEREGLAPLVLQVTVASALATSVTAQMDLAKVSAVVTVPAAPLLDPEQISNVATISQAEIAQQLAVQPGRRLFDLVNGQPGWLFEQNGVLHPRESEYDVQFLVDGIPLTDNLSPAFSPGLESNDVEAMQVRTAGFAAEYGRDLGGVVDVTTRRQANAGWHGDVAAQGGSFDTYGAEAHVGYGTARTETTASAEGAHTDRYLDPPVLPNYTNNGARENVQAEETLLPTMADTLHFSFLQGQVRYQVPNDLAQHAAGQRQDSYLGQAGGTAGWQHASSSDLLLAAHASLRDTTSQLLSNAASTPLIIDQYRGFREGYLGTSADWRPAFLGGLHDLKAGADAIARHVHEQLNYTITGPSQFDPGTATPFAFYDRRWDVEPGFYVQDSFHAGNWNVNAGIRYDVYRFVVHQSAASPRLAVSRYFARPGVLLHASYDRVFQTPAVANLLLASSPQLNAVSTFVQRLPVQPARANYYEAGFSTVFAHVLRLDGTVFRRDFRNYSDDDTLYSTGISFPIALAFARIFGEEVSLQLQNWHRFSGFASYANQTGNGSGPITGGLFIGDEGAEELSSTVGKFAVSQDQRNTLRTQLRYAATSRLWLLTRYTYNSGLPADLDSNTTIESLTQQYGAAVVRQLDFSRQRVRPNFAVDAGAGATLLQKDSQALTLEVQGANLTNHLNVINFASIFSGTGIAPPRSVETRLRFVF